MQKTSLVLLLAILFSVGACQTVDLKNNSEEEHLTERHLDFKSWGRKPECCTATGHKVAIASGGTHSSAAGLEMIDKGGNVIDAAVATAFCLAVERPQSLGIGGGGFMAVHLAKPRQGDFFLDFRESAPHRATRDMYLDAKGDVIPGLSRVGVLSVATPSLVAGLYEAHRKWGKLPWKTVVAPSIKLARDGFAVYPSLASEIAEYAGQFAKDPYLRTIFLHDDGSPLQVGDRFFQSDLASSLEQIGRQGKAVFYTGEIARKIVAFMKKEHGILDARDLRDYQILWREPLRGKFLDYSFLTAPPPAAGGVLLIEMLNVLQGFDLQALSAHPVQYTQLLQEVMKRAYADRSVFIGDPKFISESYRHLLTPGYADELRARLNLSRSTPSQAVRPPPSVPEDHGTSQLSILDADGNAVTSTITINYDFGAVVAVPGTGILLNDQMDDFSIKPGEGNNYGLVGGQANAVAPGKRPVTSSTPTIVFRDGLPVLVVGAAGGSRITSSVTQVILNDLALHPGDLRQAVFRARAHQQWIPDRLELEEGYPESVKDQLRAMGNEIAPWPYSAEVEAVGRASSGTLTAVFDPRDEGGAVAE